MHANSYVESEGKVSGLPTEASDGGRGSRKATVGPKANTKGTLTVKMDSVLIV